MGVVVRTLRIRTTGAWAEHPLAARCIRIEQQAGEASNQCETKFSHRLSLTHAPVRVIKYDLRVSLLERAAADFCKVVKWAKAQRKYSGKYLC